MKTKKKYIVSPDIIAYFKGLIYTAAFKDPFAEQQGAIQRQFYIDSVDTFGSEENRFSQRLMEKLVWYARFPSGKKHGCSSRAEDILKRTVGEVHSWTILTTKLRVLILDRRLMATVLVAMAVLVNEWMFMHDFYLSFEHFEDRVVDCIG